MDISMNVTVRRHISQLLRL